MASTRDILNSYFHPKTAPKITGLRRKTLKLTKGRSKSRLATYNRADPLLQLILERTGTREAYLRGETTLAEVKNAVRPQAVDLGVTKFPTSRAAVAVNLLKYAEQRPPKPNQSAVRPDTIKFNVDRMTLAQRVAGANIRSHAELFELIDGTRDGDGYSIYFYK